MLDRRDFLKKMAATAAALSLDPYLGVSTRGDLYTNERIGLRAEKPEGWEFSSIADFVALRDQQAFENATVEQTEILRDVEAKYIPVFIFEDPSHRDGYFAPAICLYDDPARQPDPEFPKAAHQRMLDGFELFYSDLEVHQPPEGRSLTGAEATHSHWSYLHRLEDGTSHSLRVQSLMVFRGSRVQTFHLVDEHPRTLIPQATWERFVDSIEFAPVEGQGKIC